MTLRHMKIFLAVYRTRHMTRAAQQLSMTQPAVTRAIQEIESYYGIRLFERINRKLYMTEMGNVFYNYAVHIVDSFDQMEKGLRDWDKLGLLRVGTSIAIGSGLLPEVLVRFQGDYPELRVRSTVPTGPPSSRPCWTTSWTLPSLRGTPTGRSWPSGPSPRTDWC